MAKKKSKAPSCPYGKAPDLGKKIMTVHQVHSIALQMAKVIAPRWGFSSHARDLARILTSMALKESTFNAYARNPGKSSTAAGLTQIVAKTQCMLERRLGIAHDPTRANILNPAHASMLSADYLCEHFKKYRTWAKALSAYNQGHANKTGDRYASSVLSKGRGLNLPTVETQLAQQMRYDQQMLSDLGDVLSLQATVLT